MQKKQEEISTNHFLNAHQNSLAKYSKYHTTITGKKNSFQVIQTIREEEVKDLFQQVGYEIHFPCIGDPVEKKPFYLGRLMEQGTFVCIQKIKDEKVIELAKNSTEAIIYFNTTAKTISIIEQILIKGKDTPILYRLLPLDEFVKESEEFFIKSFGVKQPKPKLISHEVQDNDFCMKI